MRPETLNIVLIDLVCQLLRSSGSHQRSILFPLGNSNIPFVTLGNMLCARVALAIWYSTLKNCIWVLEQPHGSFAELHPRLAALFSAIQAG